jgi:hypothetical protein
MRVKHRQQGQADAGLFRGSDDLRRKFADVVVRPAIGRVMDVVEFAYARETGLEHLDECERRDREYVFRCQAADKVVHHLAPGPEIVVFRPGLPGEACHCPLESRGCAHWRAQAKQSRDDARRRPPPVRRVRPWRSGRRGYASGPLAPSRPAAARHRTRALHPSSLDGLHSFGYVWSHTKLTRPLRNQRPAAERGPNEERLVKSAPRHPAWLELISGDAAVMVSIPHSGTEIPASVQATLVDPWLARKDTDWWLESLYDFVRRWA